jgi:flagellar hook-associated protein 1 FlgK
MSAGLLNVGTRALLASQAALTTAGHNIANVNTPGYSRQSVVMQDVGGIYSGAGYIGQGVSISTVQRNYSDFLTRQSALATAQDAADSTRADQLNQLQNVFPGGAGGLGTAVSDMLNAFSDVAAAPTDLTARSVALTRSDEAAALFRTNSTSLDSLQSGVQLQLQDSVTAINSLATRIASSNAQIAREAGSGQTPNDLLDQRDQLIHDLNQYVQTTSITASDGSVGVYLGNSQSLVLGTKVNTVSLGSGDFQGNTGNASLVVKQGSLDVPLNESNLGGGSVKGLLSFVNGDLAEGRNLLGRMAVAISTVMNEQHKLGLDLNGNPGGNLFVPVALPDGLPAVANTGNGSVSLSVSDASALAASDYELVFTGGSAGNVVRKSDGQVSAFDFGSPPVTVDGLTLTQGPGSTAAGDRFLLKPFAGAAGKMATAFTAPRALAVANAIEVRTGAGNTGGVAAASLLAQKTDPNLNAPVTLSFNTDAFGKFDGSFNVSGTGTGDPSNVAYAPGKAISYNGWTLTLTGTPQPGDTMTVQAASPANVSTNSGNATALMGLRDLALFDGSALTDGYAAAISQVGTRTQNASYSAGVSKTIAASVEADRTSVSGVNLDEEAAKLLQFQQSYQAAAKLMQVAQNVFDTLIKSFTG